MMDDTLHEVHDREVHEQHRSTIAMIAMALAALVVVAGLILALSWISHPH